MTVSQLLLPNMEEVQKIIASIWFPNLLYKPIRSTFYTLKGNLAMMNQDFDSAEKHMKKSLDLGSPMAEINLRRGM